MSHVGIVIQARTQSTRLPNKILLPFFKEKTLLDILLEKFISVNNEYKVIIATTNKKDDDILEIYADKYNFQLYRGDENNVLNRFIETAQHFDFNKIVRVCSDNPFIEWVYIEQLIEISNSKNRLDYCSFKNIDDIPVIKTHLGLFAEIVSTESLIKASKECDSDYYREHVTNYIYLHPEKFNVYLESAPAIVFNRKDLRFTIDDKDDFDNLSILYEYYIKNDSNISKTIEYIDTNSMFKNKMIKNIKKYNK